MFGHVFSYIKTNSLSQYHTRIITCNSFLIRNGILQEFIPLKNKTEAGTDLVRPITSVVWVSGHFAPSHFAPTKSHFTPYSKSLRPIQETLCSIQKLLSLNIFISFRSVLSESDNLFVSTWQSDTDDYRSRR